MSRRSGARSARLAALTLVLTGLLAGASFGDTVVLVGGGKLRGTIQREDERVVVIAVAGMGTVTVERGRVQEIRRSKPRPAADGPQGDPGQRRVPVSRRDPTPETRNDPRPPPAQDDPPPAPPAGRKPAEGKLLERRIDVRIEAGPLTQAIDAISDQGGFPVRLTPGGEALLEATRPEIRGFTGERTVGDLLAWTIEFATHRRLLGKESDGGLLLGLDHELFGPQPVESGNAVHWDDPRGDVRESTDPPGWAKPDVTRLRVEADGRSVIVTLTLADSLERVLSQRRKDGTQRAYDLVQVFLDTDDDPATGAPPRGTRRARASTAWSKYPAGSPSGTGAATACSSGATSPRSRASTPSTASSCATQCGRPGPPGADCTW